jgi:nuclease A inhibitor-like protein
LSDKIFTKEKKITAPTDGFAERLAKICTGLYYVSETDAEMTPFFGGKAAGGTKERMRKEFWPGTEAKVEERSFVEFFARLIKIQEWFSDGETERARRFLKLKKLLEENLADLVVLRAGRIQIDIYIAGIDKAGNLAGVKTRAVET